MAKYALVIGISQYNTPLRNLPKATADAEAIANLLEQHNYKVTRLPRRKAQGERWEIAPEKSVFSDELNRELKTFLQERANKQEVVIYIAGHGFSITDSTSDEQEGYIATSDSTVEGSKAIRFSSLSSLLGKSELSSLVMLLDCCYAGALLERQTIQPLQAAFNQPNYLLMTACQKFEKAREGEEHGIFTSAVLKGLHVDNADLQGVIDSSRLFSFVSTELEHSGQEPIHVGMGTAIALVNYRNQAQPKQVIEDCPYQGLEAFNEKTEHLFFGREDILQTLVGKLSTDNFVPVIGASGSGKSSVVRAKLMPKIGKQGWHVLSPITPGSDPLGKLIGAFEEILKKLNKSRKICKVSDFIRHDPGGIAALIAEISDFQQFLLVVDQFEEIFTQCSKKDERDRFIKLLMQIAEAGDQKLAVVLTIRADFLDACLDYGKLTRLLQEQVVLVSSLSNQGLKEAITRPASEHGYSLEAGLLDLILNDIGEDHQCLPLLQFALTELWKNRDQTAKKLTIEQYKEQGGIFGALDRHAERLYEGLDEAEQDYAKRICLRLIRTVSEVRATRNRRSKQHLLELAGQDLDEQQVSSVLNALMGARLLVTDEQGKLVHLAHEALMDRWDRFSQWRKDEQDLLRILDRVDDMFKDWLDDDKNPEFFIMGGLLTQVKTRWESLQSYLDPATREFCLRSIDASDASDPSITHPIDSEMAALAELAIARLVLPNPDDPSAEVMVKLYSERLNLKNTENKKFSQGAEYEIERKDLFSIQPEIRGDLIWQLTLFAKVGMMNLRWGQAFVNIETARSELLLDNRPNSWTNAEISFEGRKISKLKLLDDSFTKVAIEELDIVYQNYFNGERHVQSYGGWLKDSNRKRFQIEFAEFKEQYPEASDEEAAQYAICKTSFGKARMELGITEFTILLRGDKEEIDIKGLGLREVPTKVIVNYAKRPNSNSV
jgi:hypothetical protein